MSKKQATEETPEVSKETQTTKKQATEETPEVSKLDKEVVPAAEVAKVFTNDKERIQHSLAQEEQVRIMIPFGINESKGAVLEIGINGYFLKLKKGEYHQVPKSIADIVMRSQAQTVSALDLFSIENDPEKQKALS